MGKKKTKKTKKLSPLLGFGEIQYPVLEDVVEQKKVLEKDVFDKQSKKNNSHLKGREKKKNSMKK